jgi:hypothetical protein
VLAYDRAGMRQLLVLSAVPKNAGRIADEVQRLRTAASLPPPPPLSELEGLPPGTEIDVDPRVRRDPSSPCATGRPRLVVSDGCVRVVREDSAGMLHQRDVVIQVAAAELIARRARPAPGCLAIPRQSSGEWILGRASANGPPRGNGDASRGRT